jgi:REP element-mobilizing transposase RayT
MREFRGLCSQRLPTLSDTWGMRGFLRHPSSDNSGPGTWFLTINAHNKQELFGKVVGGHVELNALGRIVRDCWLDVPLHFPHAVLDAFIVMPNHMHPIVHLVGRDTRLTRQRDRIERFGAPVVGSLATIVRSFKSAATRAIREHTGERVEVWQSRYYDRRLWDRASLRRARKYIADNSRRWEERKYDSHIGWYLSFPQGNHRQKTRNKEQEVEQRMQIGPERRRLRGLPTRGLSIRIWSPGVPCSWFAFLFLVPSFWHAPVA